jgi:hypothetical protein
MGSKPAGAHLVKFPRLDLGKVEVDVTPPDRLK